MTVPTNLYQKASLKGNREDLLDKIFNTSPTETPITSAMGRVTAVTDFHEWQTDSLAAASAANKMIDGDDVTLDAQVATVRIGNHLQIFNGTVGVSRRANIVKKAGRGMEMPYLKGKKMLELKRNIEAMVLSPTQVAIAATTSVAGQSGGLGVQCVSNPLHNGAGATAAWTSGAPTAAITAGTNRTFTKALLDTACQNIYTTSGQFAEMLVVSPAHKVLFSAFTGIAQNRLEVKGKRQQGAVVAGAHVHVVQVDLSVDLDAKPITDAERIAPLRADNAMYTLFTSGSTGKPKGVTVTHGAALNRLWWAVDEFGWTADDVFLQKTPYTFDVSVPELFAPLMVGAKLVIAQAGAHGDPAYLARVLVDVAGYYAASGTEFYAINPARAYDSRWPPPVEGVTLGPIGGGVDFMRRVSVADGYLTGGSNQVIGRIPDVVPRDASSVTFSLTVTSTLSGGHLRLFAPIEPGAKPPEASVLNWAFPGTTRANAHVVKVGSGADDRQLEVYNGSSNTVNGILDVTGYFR